MLISMTGLGIMKKTISWSCSGVGLLKTCLLEVLVKGLDHEARYLLRSCLMHSVIEFVL